MATGHRGSVRKRTFVLFVLFALLYLALGIRLAYVQVVNRQEFVDWAKSIRLRTKPLLASRGRIFDRNLRILAVSIEASTVYGHRPELKDIPKTAARVAEMLGTGAAGIEAKLRGGTSNTIWIAKRVDPMIGREISRGYKIRVQREVEHKIKYIDKREQLPGIGVQGDTKRDYPAGPLAAQVLGFMNSDSKGAEGLESFGDHVLTGRDGLMTTEVDAQRRPIPETSHTMRNPVNGRDIVLTLDTNIQQMAEDALSKMAQTYHPESAVAVVLDPRTGEVLALANYPGFNPNTPGKSKPTLWRNRAVADLYEPGSTLKVVTVAAGLNEGMNPHATVVSCARTEKIKGGRLTCTVHHPFMSGHGAVDMFKIIQHSCNIGAAHIGLRLGAKKLYDYEKSFGLLDKIDAGFGCEAVGFMLPPEDWRVIKVANVGFGQGIAVTPLQMAAAYGVIARGGVYVQPWFVKGISGADGVVRNTKAPKPRRVISREAAQEVTKMLMVCAEEGTGKPAQIEGRTVAGKTGSAQIAKSRGGYEPGAFIASFMGFVPATRPRLVIAVVVTRPRGSHWGATVAAPVFKEIGEKALWYLKVPSDAPAKAKPSPKPVGSGKGVV